MMDCPIRTASLAASERISADERKQHWRSARNLYVQSLGIWQDLQTRNILALADRGKKDAVLPKIAECDAAFG
jgi:hypothetical protein